MKRLTLLLLFAIPASAQTANLDALLTRIATYQYGGDPSATIQLDELIGKASAPAESRRTIETRLLQFLQSNATPAGKEAAYRGLSLIGSNASIPILAPMLTTIDTADLARYALAAIPGPAVDDALRKALLQAPGDRIRIGLINSLGRRRDAKAVSVLAPLISPGNLEVAAAAAAALASIADRAALDVLSAGRNKAAGPLRDLATEAYVVCADHFAGRGEKAVAANAYKQVIAETTGAIRTRALTGITAADSKAAVPILTAEIRSADPERQVVAIRLLNGVAGSDVTKALVAELPKLPPVAQVHLLTAVASRGDTIASPAVASALRSADSAVRAAALTALGKLGDASSVAVLTESAASGKDPEQSAARRSLYTLRGTPVDAAIVSGIASSSGRTKIELMIAAGERATLSAAPALSTAAQNTDTEVRREALRALRNVGGAAQAPALLDLVLKASTAPERREAAQTLALALKRSQPAPVKSVLSAYGGGATKEARLSLLDVLGQTSSGEALPLLRSGIKDADPEIARGAILALTNWDDATPLHDLLALARGASRSAPEEAPGSRGVRGALPPTNNLQILALRGVLKLALLPSQRSVSENGLLLAEAMRLASQAPEKRTILSLLPSFPSKESLAVAQAATRDREVANEAKLALDQVNEALRLK
ncbi:MAG: HEAT repeat domain-containing protein [Bryobacteraceae bacterium]